jgi:penicillin-binding protein 1A
MARLHGDHCMMRGFTQFAAFVRRVMARRLSMRALAVSGTVSVAAVGLVYLALAWAAPILPLNTDLYALNRPAAYTFLDEKGEVVGRRGAAVGERLKLSEMPPHLPAAFLVVEDRRFYRHDGIDFRGLVRAALVDIKAGRFEQGGSTITQQLVKILFLTPDRTISRKLVEMAGARQLERLLTKDQILELYLNRIYLGAGAYGVDGAARAYFGKSARDVTLAEAAMLASLTNAPTLNSPRRNLKAAQQRSARVLRALVTHGGMKESDIAEGLAKPATIVAEAADSERSYFLDVAADETKSLVPGAHGDFMIVTTIDVAMQKAASDAIETVMKRRGASAQAKQAALVAMRPDGAVRAIMGGRDYVESGFNRATNAHRSPGSAFKPFVYLTALEQGLARDTIRYDEPIAIKDWSPDNFDGSYAGAVTLQGALVRSINTVAVGLGQEVGLPSVISTAQRLGIESPLKPNASLPIGTSEVTPLELTAAYASFASLGVKADPYTIIEVRSADGNVLYQRAPQQPRRVISEDIALEMNAMLFEVVASGTGRGAALRGREIAGKTGTSADFRDAWFVGYSPELVAGVWVGNDDFTPMKKVTGGALPAQIWSGFMQAALKGTKPSKLPRAEPIYDGPLIAEVESGTFFDRLGGFFERLFGGPAQARTQIEPPPRALQRPQIARPEPPRAEAEPEYSRDRYGYQQENADLERRRQPSDAEREAALDRFDYAFERRRQAMRPQMRGETEPRVGSGREYARDRYEYQQDDRYVPPRRGYAYRDDPRYAPRYAYPPRYGYGGGDYRERWRDRDRRYFNRRSPYD